MMRIIATATLMILLLLGCMPEPDTDDNGDRSWAQQAVPELLGRKIRGWEETDVLAQAVGLLGRSKVSQAIMFDDAFRIYWSEILIDHIQTQRPGASGNRTGVTSCWNTPMAGPDSGDLARWIETHHPDGTLAVSAASPYLGARPYDFNMVDIIRSSIELDNLSPIYLSNLIPFVMNEGYNNVATERLGGEFDEIYLGRPQSCMTCHNENYSASDLPDWKRTFQPFPKVETKVFGGALGSAETLASSHAIFNPEIRGGDFYPWDIDPSCVRKSGDPLQGLRQSIPGSGGAYTKLGSVTGTGKHILDLEEALRDGVQSLSGSAINSFVNEGESTDLSDNEALAYLLALKITDNLWQEVMGERLTVVHGYSRNSQQRETMRFLAEDKLIAERWSLRNVLEAILTSRWFNRSAPYVGDSTINHSAYHLPMVLDPWLAKAPGETSEPINNFNGQGRVVHRYSPRNLIRSAGTALGHASLPAHFAAGSGTDRKFLENLGQYLNDYSPGTRSVDFQGMMSWAARYGSCQTPTDTDTDWINELTSAAGEWDALHPTEPPITLRDLSLTMKDWLVGEATLDHDVSAGTESDAIEALFGIDLDTPLNSISPSFLEDRARLYCGSLISSPHFMLAGIRPGDLGSGSRLRVCNPGEPCTWIETCEAWLPLLEEASDEDLECTPSTQTLRRTIHLTPPTLNRPELTRPTAEFSPEPVELPRPPIPLIPPQPPMPTPPEPPAGLPSQETAAPMTELDHGRV
ncbi:MAG: hypothetical protein CL917_02595 [Deltaproteobacteria bacterium]|nr:hypothetical protein [Deltaproteobacteria bacterium]